ncbi:MULTISPECIES: hypothetical protein [Streptomyces]|uniref:hypothetical protein n=1 Tax=Streptomyces TaxID=1883 RepID=UPI001E36AE5D|nr:MULTISPECIES: hypothetical protein [Streptomyces]UFQ14353.1 hypothetical protein J2N69_04580 [Streptomyces huasconensis]WCL83953.1 hypothetical protein PPN52_04570 [Streptomyces sp. JCM 35825]
MWHGQQPPGGEQNQSGREPNPYRQPGYQQPNPYAQQTPWDAPTMPGQPRGGAPEPPRGGGRRTKVIALTAAAAVVVAAGATGALLLGGGKDDTAKPGPAESSSAPGPSVSGSADHPRAGAEPGPTVPGWKVVVNPKRGIAFDVPPEWSLESRDWAGGYVEDKDADDESAPFLVAYAAPAYFKERWCGSDEDKDGTKDYVPLAAAGTRGNKGAKSTEQVARNDATMWVYGAYTQPDKKKVTTGPVESYTTKSGLKGSLASATSTGADQQGACDSDGKATVFAFEDSAGKIASWSFHGAKGVREELPDATVRKILSTVREYEMPES